MSRHNEMPFALPIAAIWPKLGASVEQMAQNDCVPAVLSDKSETAVNRSNLSRHHQTSLQCCV